VNLAEVVSKLQDKGYDDDQIDEMSRLLDLTPSPFDERTAILAGKMRSTKRKAGLSIGDRACLALASSVGAAAIITDRAWASIDLGVAVELAR
jgi:ribonuclease VapC